MSSANMSPSRSLGAEAEAIKEEIKEENKIAEQNSQLKDWEDRVPRKKALVWLLLIVFRKAKALKDRIEERERAEQAEKV
jgi:hypothetical protein